VPPPSPPALSFRPASTTPWRPPRRRRSARPGYGVGAVDQPGENDLVSGPLGGHAAVVTQRSPRSSQRPSGKIVAARYGECPAEVGSRRPPPRDRFLHASCHPP